MFLRIITPLIKQQCFAGKVIIIYGPRQVGKTTITQTIQQSFPDKKSLYLTGDDIEIKEILIPSIKVLSSLVASYDLIIIDEAQRITDIGLVLKLLVDTYPDKQFIATWSSSFELANTVSEPLTGRAYIHYLYPLSLEEIGQAISTISLEQRMIYGSYPESLSPIHQTPQQYLKSLIDNYLYKDLLNYEGIKKFDIIYKLVQALALQIGNEFSYMELARTIGSNKDTVAKYITILEQAFIIKTLAPLHNNQRKEIKSHKKVYFWDLGVRNAVINNFNPLSLRNDVGQLWENLCFIERTKYISYHQILHNQYFWRKTAWPEIDYIEQSNDHYHAREFKYSTHKWASLPQDFAQSYPSHDFDVIRPDTIVDFVM